MTILEVSLGKNSLKSLTLKTNRANMRNMSQFGPKSYVMVM